MFSRRRGYPGAQGARPSSPSSPPHKPRRRRRSQARPAHLPEAVAAMPRRPGGPVSLRGAAEQASPPRPLATAREREPGAHRLPLLQATPGGSPARQVGSAARPGERRKARAAAAKGGGEARRGGARGELQVSAPPACFTGAQGGARKAAGPQVT